MALVAVDGHQRDDFELRQLREGIDEAVGDAFTQVFRVGIAGGIDEREDGDGIEDGSFESGRVGGFVRAAEAEIASDGEKDENDGDGSVKRSTRFFFAVWRAGRLR